MESKPVDIHSPATQAPEGRLPYEEPRLLAVGSVPGLTEQSVSVTAQ